METRVSQQPPNEFDICRGVGVENFLRIQQGGKTFDLEHFDGPLGVAFRFVYLTACFLFFSELAYWGCSRLTEEEKKKAKPIFVDLSARGVEQELVNKRVEIAGIHQRF